MSDNTERDEPRRIWIEEPAVSVLPPIRIILEHNRHDQSALHLTEVEAETLLEALAARLPARDQRVKAEAWDAGARWAFEEITGEPENRFGLTPGDNPHRGEVMPYLATTPDQEEHP